jgi:hypothetical protein
MSEALKQEIDWQVKHDEAMAGQQRVQPEGFWIFVTLSL